MNGLHPRSAPPGRAAACVTGAIVIAVAGVVLSGHSVPAAGSPGGTITTFAGGGAPGDGGAPTQANFGPTSVAMDSSGNLYIADTQNQRIRKIAAGADGAVGEIGSNGALADTDDTITTVAGSGQICTTSGKRCGDGGPALSAALAFPEGVAVDAAGNIYVADASSNSIRFVCEEATVCAVAGGIDVAAGTIATIAGNGTAGFNGDGPATSSELQGLTGIALDAAGNLFIADTHNQRIRELCLQAAPCATYAGTIAPGSLLTVAGTGVLLDSGDGGPGTSAGVELPLGVAVDASENVYVTTGAHEVREVADVAAGGTITTLASGDLICKSTDILCFPRGIGLRTAPGGSPSLYVTDTFKNGVVQLNLSTLALSTFAGSGTSGMSGDGGPATSADLAAPYGVVAAPSGSVYVGDFLNDNIREVSSAGVIDTVAGSPMPAAVGLGDGGAAAQGQLSVGNLAPKSGGMASFGGSIDVADTGHNLVRQVNGGVITTFAGEQNAGTQIAGDGGPAAKATLDGPEGVAFDSAGDLYIADTQFGLVRRVDATSGTLTTVAGVISAGHSVQGYNGDGAGTATELDFPTSVAADQVTGDVYIADTGNGLVRKLTPAGALTTVAGSVTSAGQPSQGYSGDGGAATQAQLNEPTGLGVDPDGNVFIADTGNDVIREVTLAGVISTVAGSFSAGPGFSGDGSPATSAQLNSPLDVAVDSGGNLYIADSANNAIRFVCIVATKCTSGSTVLPQGIIATLGGSGSGVSGFSGDGGASSAALLSRPSAVTVDASGNVYTADSQNNRIREIADPVSYTAPVPVPRPTPAPTPTPTATPTTTLLPAVPGSDASGFGGDAGSSVGVDRRGGTAGVLGSVLSGLERTGLPQLAARPAPSPTPSASPAASPRPSTSPAAGSGRGPGPPGVARGLAVPTAGLSWWLAAAILGAAVLGAVAGTLFWRWRRPAAAPIAEPSDPESGPRLRQR